MKTKLPVIKNCNTCAHRQDRGNSNYVFDGETVFNELTEKVTKRLADNYNEMMYKVHNDKYNEFEEDIKLRQDRGNKILTQIYEDILKKELFKNVKNNE
jgi:hypothetical protein